MRIKKKNEIKKKLTSKAWEETREKLNIIIISIFPFLHNQVERDKHIIIYVNETFL